MNNSRLEKNPNLRISMLYSVSGTATSFSIELTKIRGGIVSVGSCASNTRFPARREDNDWNRNWHRGVQGNPES